MEEIKSKKSTQAHYEKVTYACTKNDVLSLEVNTAMLEAF